MKKLTMQVSLLSILAIMPATTLAQTDDAASICANGVCMETETFGGTPNLIGSLVFDQFDPALGTLLSIDVKAELTSEGGSFAADNDSTQPAEFEVSFGAEGTISSADVGLFSAVVPIPTPAVADLSTSQSAMFSLAGDDGDDITQFNAGGPDWDEFNGVSTTDIQMGTIDASLFAGYEGTGTFAVDFDIVQIGSSTSGGGVFRQIDPVTATGNVMVTYNYEPFPSGPVIPEPSSNLLLAIGGAILMLRMRRAR